MNLANLEPDDNKPLIVDRVRPDDHFSNPEFPAHFGRNLLIEKDFTAISAAICSQNLFRLPLTVPNSPRDIWGMVRKPRTVHVAKITNTVKGVTYPSYYLRRSFRLDGKVKHETLGNLSDLPVHVIDLISRSLKGKPSSRPPRRSGLSAHCPMDTSKRS